MSEGIVPKMKRRYFEAFGDLEQEIKFLRKLLFLLSVIFMFFILLLFFVSAKPPVVIRVSEVEGAQAIQDLKTNNEPSRVELIHFAKRFTIRYTAYNSYTIARDFTEALNQMTVRFQREAKKKMIDSGLLSKISEAKINTELEFKEERLERETKETGLVSLVGTRKLSQYGNEPFKKDTLFRAELVLKKVPRTRETPEGLLVDEYREILLSEFTNERN